ncbi:hypothetical protein [Actinoplanes sp. NPDC026670]|jgi:ABC-type proline/glycine betaine transport system substrate-binding protein
MRANLRRAAILVATAVALALSAGTLAAPAAAEPVCQAGSNWDGVLKICR